jgi:hypothetical protein
MKVYTKLKLVLQFAIVILLVGIGSMVAFIRENYPTFKGYVVHTAKTLYGRYQAHNQKQGAGLNLA